MRGLHRPEGDPGGSDSAGHPHAVGRRTGATEVRELGRRPHGSDGYYSSPISSGSSEALAGERLGGGEEAKACPDHAGAGGMVPSQPDDGGGPGRPWPEASLSPYQALASGVPDGGADGDGATEVAVSQEPKGMPDGGELIRRIERARILKWIDAAMAASTDSDLRKNLEATLKYLKEWP